MPLFFRLQISRVPLHALQVRLRPPFNAWLLLQPARIGRRWPADRHMENHWWPHRLLPVRCGNQQGQGQSLLRENHQHPGRSRRRRACLTRNPAGIMQPAPGCWAAASIWWFMDAPAARPLDATWPGSKTEKSAALQPCQPVKQLTGFFLDRSSAIQAGNAAAPDWAAQGGTACAAFCNGGLAALLRDLSEKAAKLE